MRHGEITAEMWTAIRHCMGAPVEVSIQHNPARAELDVLNVAFPELSRRTDEIPPVSDDVRDGEIAHGCLFRPTAGTPVSLALGLTNDSCTPTAAVLFAGAIAASGSFSARL
jgi:hypothetical protein